MLGNLFVRSFPRSAWERKMSTLRVEDAPVGECFEGRVQWSPRSGWLRCRGGRLRSLAPERYFFLSRRRGSKALRMRGVSGNRR